MVNPVSAIIGEGTHPVLLFLIITSPEIMATPYGDFGKPVFKRAGFFKTSQRLVGLDKGVVGHFRRVIPGYMVPDDSRHIVLISIHQNFEGVNIPPKDILDNRGIVRSIICKGHLYGGKNIIVVAT